MGVIAGFPQIRFCEAPERGAATRLNLGRAGISWNGGTKVLRGARLGMPSLSGEAGSRSRYWTERTLELPLRVLGSKADAINALGLVARELVRESNWLEVWLDEQTGPRWFRTYAAAPEQLDLTHVVRDPDYDDIWTTTLRCPADPFALGEEQPLGSWTVTNHPSAGANPLRVTLPNVLGEVPASVRVKVAKSGSGSGAGGMLGPAVISSRVAPVVVGSPSWGGAVGGTTSDASMVAGSRRTTSGALAAWTAAASWTPPSLAADVARWTPLIRIAGSADGGAFWARWRIQSGAGSARYTEGKVVHVRSQARWLHLGDVSRPGMDVEDAADLGASGATTVTLEVRRATSGGELWLDGVMVLAPAGTDGDLLSLSPDAVGTGAVAVVVDGRHRRAALAAGTSPARSPGVSGRWPMVHPGEDNVLTVLQNLNPTLTPGYTDSITSTATVTATTRGLYLWGV
ncbi:hypothetical protein [Nocardioides sp. R-C-SC26]|uniref:hypothetical protein n=1 Tax=Nocardioides sp. R-C-SC26 TaxID=2870414 RepID=UPI001E64E16E|nr:hypothetical protein [Nocardioides sp. R-C-SC26]